MNYSRIVLLIIILSISSICYAEQSFLSIADIHFDPFASCHMSTQKCKLITKLNQLNSSEWDKAFLQTKLPIAQSGEDTNYTLLEKTLLELAIINKNSKPDFAFAIGDFLAHSFHKKYILYSHDFSNANYQIFVKKTISFLTIKLKNALPNINIYPAIGNNDSDKGDYHINTNGKFLSQTAISWSSFFNDSNQKNQFLANFANNGYYAITPKNNSNLRIIILNSVLFSTKATGKNIKQEAIKELDWLDKQLKSTKKQKQHALIIFHIPPGVNVYSLFKKPWGKPETFWLSTYTEMFTNEVKKFPDNIDAIFPAHIHQDVTRLLPVKQVANIPVYFTPSISPIFGNNPEILLFTHSINSYRPIKITHFTYQLNNKQESQWTIYNKVII